MGSRNTMRLLAVLLVTVPVTCATSPSCLSGDPHTGIVSAVNLIDVNAASADEQQEIATSLVGLCFDEPDDLKSAIAAAFRDRGFSHVEVTDLQISIVDNAPPPQPVKITAQLSEGARYRLSGISFKHTGAITNHAALRGLFKVEDGADFNSAAIRDGLDAVRHAYADFGYINFTPVPNATVDDINHTIALEVDCVEGSQFFVRSFTIVGADRDLETALLARWRLFPPSVYNERLARLFFEDAKDLLPRDVTFESNLELSQHLDDRTVEIDLVLRHSARRFVRSASAK